MAGLLSERTRAEIRAAMARYPRSRSAAVAALRAAQEQLGWLPAEAVAEVAAEMDLDPNALHQLVTFYDMFYDRPKGSYVLGVCNNLSCYLNGSDQLLGYLQEKLGIAPGETTEDGLFTLRTVECLAACGNAPAMMVNEDYYERLTREDVDRLLEKLRREGRGDAENSEPKTRNPEPGTRRPASSTQDSEGGRQ